MAISRTEFEQRLAAMRERYANTLTTDLAAIRRQVGRVVSGEQEALDDAVRAAHNLAGTGGTFGFAALGDAARVLEHALGELRDGGDPQSVNAALDALLNCARNDGLDVQM